MTKQPGRAGRQLLRTTAAFLALLAPASSPLLAQPEGGSVAFEGGKNEYIRVPTDASLDVQNFTVELWVRRESPRISQHAVVSRSAAGVGMANGLVLTYGYLDQEAWTVFLDGNPFTGTRTQELGQWVHLALVYDGAEIVLYVDGEEDLREFYPQFFNWDSDFYFGIEQDCADDCFDADQALGGQIDDIRIWSVPRTRGQVQTDMLTKIPIVDRDFLVAYWNLNETAGPLVLDQSGLGNHAVLGIPRHAPPGVPDHELVPDRAVVSIAGTVDGALMGPSDVLFINGSSGGVSRVVTMPAEHDLIVSLSPPPHGPVSAPFALYVQVGGTTDPTSIGDGSRWSAFPFPLGGRTPDNVFTVVNNLGSAANFGEPVFLRGHTPQTLIFRGNPARRSLSLCFQGLMRDNGSESVEMISVTNSVDVFLE